MTFPAGYFERLSAAASGLVAPAAAGRVAAARGSRAEVEGLDAPAGAVVRIGLRGGGWVEAEVTGVARGRLELAMLARAEGVSAGSPAELESVRPMLGVSERMLGRCVDSLGRPADGLGPVSGRVPVELLARAGSSGQGCAAGVPGLCFGLHALARGGDELSRARFLARLAAQFEGPSVVALVGGSARSHREFLDSLGEARARTAAVLEPTVRIPARARRAALAAGAIARFVAEVRGKALLLVDWRTGLRPPVAEVALGERVAAAWSVLRGAGPFDLELDSPAGGEARP